MANILFIDQYAVMGGAQRILVDLASAFVRDGHRVTALFPGSGGVAEALNSVGAETQTYSLMQMRAGKKGPIERLRYFALAMKTVRSIRHAVAGKNLDFIYVNGPRAMLPGVLAARRMHLPVVAAVHLIHEGVERKLLTWCFARPHVKLVSFCSRFAAEPFPNVGAKGRVLPNWVAPQFLFEASIRQCGREALGLGNDDVAVGVLGRVSKSKGQRLFLNASIPLLAHHQRLTLFVAGGADFEDSQEEMELRAMCGPYGNKVRFLDKAPAIEFFDSMDVAVVPSIRPESFGLVAIEAMARSRPVVATNRGGLVDSVEDGTTGFLVGPDADSMREAIGRLIADPELRASMGEAGRTRVAAHFSPDVLIPQAVTAILGAAC